MSAQSPLVSTVERDACSQSLDASPIVPVLSTSPSSAETSLTPNSPNSPSSADCLGERHLSTFSDSSRFPSDANEERQQLQDHAAHSPKQSNNESANLLGEAASRVASLTASESRVRCGGPVSILASRGCSAPEDTDDVPGLTQISSSQALCVACDADPPVSPALYISAFRLSCEVSLNTTTGRQRPLKKTLRPRLRRPYFKSAGTSISVGHTLGLESPLSQWTTL